MNNDRALNFLEEIIEDDLKSGKHTTITTRFPPEPNGYLHIGHAKSICTNFGLARRYNGYTNLRFDDTNPVTEDTEYVESIQEDIRWLGFEWKGKALFASDYFDIIYQCAERLINKGLSYVDFSNSEQMAKEKGTPTQAGVESKYRNTLPEDNLMHFRKMRNGEYNEGECVLRAKIDMASPNMLLRDPVIYRIKKAHHHRTANSWCIYPMYDFAHPISDSMEQITHSICTMEFEVHRPFYDWTLQNLEMYPSRQYEFARLNMTYTVMSKRKLLQLVNEGNVQAWNDPRMPTISGMRRRGYTAESIRNFAEKVGVTRRDNIIDVGLLEFCVREDLNKKAQRVMVVTQPLKVTITNYPPNKTEWLEIENNPENAEDGKRKIEFGNTLYIEQEDFMENPPKKFFRLTPQGFIRLKGAYIIQCNEVIKDDAGNITELKCLYFENSKSGNDTSGIEVKAVTHWVNAQTAIRAELREYDRLFKVEDPAGEDDFKTSLNPNSLRVISNALCEPSLASAELGKSYQFMRKGYYCIDTDSTNDKLIFNQTVTLKDAWAKTRQLPK